MGEMHSVITTKYYISYRFSVGVFIRLNKYLYGCNFLSFFFFKLEIDVSLKNSEKCFILFHSGCYLACSKEIELYHQ